jgi:hypothetical protein
MAGKLNTDYPGGKKPTGNEEFKKQLIDDFQAEGGATDKPDFPTETIELPSKGVLYEEGNPLRSGKVELKYMTAKEEDILTSQNLIQQGTVIDKLLKALVVGNVPYHKLLLGDKNAIMIAARVLGYGADYEAEINDPWTNEKEKLKINLQDLKHISGLKKGKNYVDGKNEFDFELPVSKRKLKWKILNHGDEVKIALELKKNQRGKRRDDPKTELTTRMKYMIIGIDGDESDIAINKFVKNQFLAQDSRAFREHVQEISPDVDMSVWYYSESTGNEQKMKLPLGVNFFWPGAAV